MASVRLDVKAVPGARCDEVAGWLGDRLKIRISAPPEGGRANSAIVRLLAAELGLKAGAIEIVRGQAVAEKTLLITGTPWEAILAKWPRPSPPSPPSHPAR
ncbi:MAG: DUF167 domain-containing protein [Phycisphaerales bacterium]|nr:DUF167 domain-containing protein [Phycisphaerales bacterium]